MALDKNWKAVLLFAAMEKLVEMKGEAAFDDDSGLVAVVIYRFNRG